MGVSLLPPTPPDQGEQIDRERAEYRAAFADRHIGPSASEQAAPSATSFNFPPLESSAFCDPSDP